MATHEERRKITRAAIVASGRECFGTNGFDATTIDEVVNGAGIAKGALYHYFPSKQAVFEAVFEEESAETVKSVYMALGDESDLVNAVLSGARAFFSECSDPTKARILLSDGPSVLGWTRWREIDARHFGGAVELALNMAMQKGQIRTQPIDVLTRLIMGAMQEAVLACAGRDDFDDAAEAYLAGIEAILDGLR